jgi:hypothetical protein
MILGMQRLKSLSPPSTPSLREEIRNALGSPGSMDNPPVGIILILLGENDDPVDNRLDKVADPRETEEVMMIYGRAETRRTDMPDLRVLALDVRLCGRR